MSVYVMPERRPRTSEQRDFVAASNHFADPPTLETQPGEARNGPVHVTGADDQGHPNAHVQRPEHLPLFDPARPLDLFEDGGNGPGALLDPDSEALGDDPGDVIIEAAA